MKISHPIKTLAMLITALLLSSCATTQTEVQKCRNTDWHHLGYQDGIGGRNKKDLKKVFADCGPTLVINKSAYDKGWQQGVKRYCTSRNGLSLGMQGKLYNNICPDNKISTFDKAWKQGLRDYCIPSNGYIRGFEGKSFPGYCAPDQNVAFKKAYKRGHRVYQRLAKLKDEYDKLNTQVQHIQDDIQSKEKTLRDLEQAFSNQPFSPQKQYRIQKNKIYIKQLATKMDQLIEKRDAILQKYADMEKQYQT